MNVTTSTVSDDFPTLTGRQQPHHLSVFPGSDEHGEKAVTLARRAGTKSMPWQRAALLAMLATTAGLWTHPDCCLIVPRQNGKSLILVLRCLYGLFVLGERIIYSSQRWPTAEDTYNRLWSIIKARPSLRDRVVKNTCSQGKGYIELKSGAKIVFCTRSNDSGRGFDEVDLVVYDEAYNLTDGEISALAPTQLASKNPQTIYASSAVNAEQHPNGSVLAAIRKRGLAAEEGLYFAEHMAPDELDRESEEAARYANPSYGVIQNWVKVKKLMRGFSTPAGRKSFDVEVLGRGDWPVEVEVTSWAVIPEEKWVAMEDHNPKLTGTIALALDLTPDRQWWTIAAAQRTTNGKIHVEVGYHQAGAHKAIAAYLKLLVQLWDPCALVIDRKSPAMVIVPFLAAMNIEPETTTAPQMVQAAGGFYDDAMGELLTHTDQRILTEAVAGATKRELPGGDWAWDRTGDALVSPLIVASLARWALITFGSTVKVPPASPAFERRPTATNELNVLSAAF